MKKSRPPPKKSHKKKEPKEAPPTPPPKVEEEPVSGRRKRTQVQIYGNVTPTVQALKRGGSTIETPTKSSRSTRSSGRLNPDSPASASKPVPLPRGTRVSRRLHSLDDEWQQVPDGWMDDKSKANGREDDEESELSALTDEEEHEAELKAVLKPSKVRFGSCRC